MIGNTTVDAVDLTGWRVVDKNDAADTDRELQLIRRRFGVIVLSGHGAQLSNKGGTIRLVNPSGVLIHAVSYSKAGRRRQPVRPVQYVTYCQSAV